MTDHEQVAIEHLDQAESDLVNDQWTPVTNAHIGQCGSEAPTRQSRSQRGVLDCHSIRSWAS